MVRYGNFSHAEVLKMAPYELDIFTALTLAAMQEEKKQRDKK